MKVSLVVMTVGKGQGKTIPIPLSPFLIGRDPQCHLRPASPIISKRHCALVVEGTKVRVRDFNSTNGTFVNNQQIKGEVELKDDDKLQVGPLVFRLRVESAVAAPVNQPTPVPPTKVPAGAPESDDELAATLLLDLPDEGSSNPLPIDSEGIPQGSTIMEMMPPADTKEEPAVVDAKKKEKEKAQQQAGDTTEAAKAILEKYLRRTRT